jgi:anti-sigma regulatory factor (Ser/Thr protein kinase)
LELPDRSILFAIGDVAGHGALAAGLTGQLRTALRIAALDTNDVALLLGRLDRFLAGLDDFEMTTAMLIRLDRERGEFTWASAGHLPPLLRHPDGTTEYLLERVGPPLGAIPQPAFHAHQASIALGSCLVLYTDGLVERRVESIDTGLERLAACVSDSAPDPAELDACAVALMNVMTDDQAPEDDIALFVIHRDVDVRTITLTLPNQPATLRKVRQTIAERLRDHAAPDRIVDDLVLVASELCSNAMEHSGLHPDDSIVVRLTTMLGAVELSVEDAGTWATDGPRQGGRGLQIVREISDTVDVTRTDPGTRVTVRRTYPSEPTDR